MGLTHGLWKRRKKRRFPKMKRLSSNWPELVSELESYIPRLHYRRVCWEFPSGQWIQCKTDGASRGNPGFTNVEGNAVADSLANYAIDEEISGTFEELFHMQNLIIRGGYVLSPLEIKRVMGRDLRDFLKGLIPERPEFMITGGGGEDIIHVIMPSRKEDALVLMGLSITLLRLYRSEMPEEGYRIDCLLPSFYSCLQQEERVDRLYRIDLGESIREIPSSMIKSWVKPLVGDGSVYRLISSFLSLTVFEDLGGIRVYTSSGGSGIPPAGDITRVLLDIALKNLFDSQFPKRFPGIAFHRFVNEVYIFIRKNEKVLFDDKAGYALLEELGLRGKIESIGPGDDPLPP
ncbi:hypothetical protein P3S67_006951 [Capsicum chacoense]